MVLQVGKTRGLDLKQEGELTKVITDQNIQPAIHVEVIHCNPLPRLLWHIVSLQGSLGGWDWQIHSWHLLVLSAMFASSPGQYRCWRAFCWTLVAERWPWWSLWRYSSWRQDGMTILGPINSSPSSVESWSLKSQYALAILGVCLLWCGHPCWVSWYTVPRMGSSLIVSLSLAIQALLKAM